MPGSSSVQGPRAPEAGIPKDASVIPLKVEVELLLMVVPETYEGSIPNTQPRYDKPNPMPLLIDEETVVDTMPAPRVVGPVIP